MAKTSAYNRSNVMGDTPTNAVTFEQLLNDAAVWGSEEGKGNDAQLKLALRTLQAAFFGAFDLTKNKHGQGTDDATKVAETFTKSRSGNNMFTAKQRATMSKLSSWLRTIGRCGAKPFGHGEPINIVNHLVDLLRRSKQDPALAPRLMDPMNVIVNFCREQVKRDDVFDKEDLKRFIFRREPSLASAEDILTAVRKTLISLKNGKAAKNTAKDDSPEVDAAISSLTDRLKSYAARRQTHVTGAPKRQRKAATATPAPAELAAV